MREENDGADIGAEINAEDITVDVKAEEEALEETPAEEAGAMPADSENAAGSEDDVSANGIESGEEDEVTVTDIGSCGDFLVYEFSLEANVKRASKYIKLPEKIAAYIFALIYIAVGALCAAIPEHIEFVLPYIVGGAIGTGALVQFVFAIVTREYKSLRSNKTASSLILIGLSIMIIIEHEWAHTFIPIVWGVIGLCEAAHAFNHALSRISGGIRASYFIVKGVIEVAVAFLLLYKPERYGELHIIVFGVSLIIDGITALPFVKKLIEKL